jgi:hypothetical protein
VKIDERYVARPTLHVGQRPTRPGARRRKGATPPAGSWQEHRVGQHPVRIRARYILRVGASAGLCRPKGIDWTCTLAKQGPLYSAGSRIGAAHEYRGDRRWRRLATGTRGREQGAGGLAQGRRYRARPRKPCEQQQENRTRAYRARAPGSAIDRSTPPHSSLPPRHRLEPIVYPNFRRLRPAPAIHLYVRHRRRRRPGTLGTVKPHTGERAGCVCRSAASSPESKRIPSSRRPRESRAVEPPALDRARTAGPASAERPESAAAALADLCFASLGRGRLAGWIGAPVQHLPVTSRRLVRVPPPATLDTEDVDGSSAHPFRCLHLAGHR